jgi:hypothetical protein
MSQENVGVVRPAWETHVSRGPKLFMVRGSEAESSRPIASRSPETKLRAPSP